MHVATIQTFGLVQSPIASSVLAALPQLTLSSNCFTGSNSEDSGPAQILTLYVLLCPSSLREHHWKLLSEHVFHLLHNRPNCTPVACFRQRPASQPLAGDIMCDSHCLTSPPVLLPCRSRNTQLARCDLFLTNPCRLLLIALLFFRRLESVCLMICSNIFFWELELSWLACNSPLCLPFSALLGLATVPELSAISANSPEIAFATSKYLAVNLSRPSWFWKHVIYINIFRAIASPL